MLARKKAKILSHFDVAALDFYYDTSAQGHDFKSEAHDYRLVKNAFLEHFLKLVEPEDHITLALNAAIHRQNIFAFFEREGYRNCETMFNKNVKFMFLPNFLKKFQEALQFVIYCDSST